MTKTEMKRKAQDDLLHYAASAFLAASDSGASEAEVAILREQFQRIEKLFGYVPGSTRT